MPDMEKEKKKNLGWLSRGLDFITAGSVSKVRGHQYDVKKAECEIKGSGWEFVDGECRRKK